MILLLDNIRSAQNVGSIIRSAESFGVEKIILSGITPNLNNPKVKKTSLSAEKNIEIKEVTNTLESIQKYKKSGFMILSLELHENAQDISRVGQVTKKTVLVVGNEVSGVSGEILKLSDIILQIPMHGKKESLNVSVATGIALYELTKI